eukprot:CAMPEP_0201632570 /NCGR_PEP_ID=MMETSP0493-20130528/6173_1 /ASSEMBLY_ACC=CAM_ASM_000838 /TAXON_ID=420259 /ORGANISM="Thalassiosira gravida, Strain GMp14c1" /LENGTH=907 /DNA_ID=CAMNT_0048104123 /DNA_START=148 /DNA_END=2871 /DNA_ORIENTATION=+
MDSAQRGVMASPYSSHTKYQPAPYGNGNGSTRDREQKTKRGCHRRLCRIFTVALIFVIISVKRMYHRGKEHSYFDFLTGLSFDDVAVVTPADRRGAGGASASLSLTAIDKKYASAEDAHLVMFYNLYIPPNVTGQVNDEEDVVNGDVANAIHVIKDQMGQISSVLLRMEGEGGGVGSNGRNGEKVEKKGVVFYNLIGNEAAVPPREMSALCRKLHPRLECQRIQHYEDAGEEVTLQDLHDYCRSDHKPSSTNINRRRRVTYLHSKGSYHSQKENHIWRRIMTDAALHPSCLDPPTTNGTTCDICSAQFYIKYAIMFPGNMWTADCSYIRKLIPPLTDGEYERKKEASIERFLTLRMWGVLDATLDTDNAEHFGLGRYAWEHWVASSPHVRPCEVHTMEVGPLILLGKDPQGRKFGPEYYDWGMAPRRIEANLGGIRNARLKLLNSPNLSFREYYYMAGNLVKWFYLYGPEGVPSQDSWVWRVFPEGQRWKELVGQHGENAVEETVKASAPRFHSAFVSEDVRAAPDTSLQLFHDDDGLLSLSNPPLVVFYQILFPPDNKEKALAAVKSQFDVLSLGQFDNESGTFDQNRKILLYYTITGGRVQEVDLISNLCKEKSDRITCRQRGNYDAEGVYGENVHHLHAFCNVKPSYHVVYITNRLDDSLATKIKAITSAVMSTMCLPSEESCNVCGAEFYPLPFLHFTGNMFSASCGYVNKLMSPSTFENAMTDVAGAALVAEMKETYTTKLFPLGTRILGSYQHSIDHWIGAHPDLKPCDIAPTSTDKLDETILDQMKLYSRAPAPRRGSASPGYLVSNSEWRERESKSRLKRTISLREYYYLAGNIFRWKRLYDKLPNANSWVWEWFPDGQLWELAARTSGENAVNVLANQLSEQLALEEKLAQQLAIKDT